MGDSVILRITKEATREDVKRAGGIVIPPQAPGEPMPQLTPPPPEKLDTEGPPAAVAPAIAAPAIAVAEDKDGIMAAHKEKLRIADELCHDAAQKVAEAETKAKEYAKAQVKITAMKKELAGYQTPDPNQPEIERLSVMIQGADMAIKRHQTLLLELARYKDSLEVSYAAEADMPALQAKVTLYDDTVEAMASGGIPSWLIAEATIAH